MSPGLDLMHHCLDALFYVLFFVTVFQLKVASFLLYISYNFVFLAKQGGYSYYFILLNRCDYFQTFRNFKCKTLLRF